MDPTGLIWAAVAMLAGGVLKGAVGAGAPIIAVPVLALAYDVPFAVAVYTIPNLAGNAWQAWVYRAHQPSRQLVWMFAGMGMVGVLVGSALLVALSGSLLLASVACIVFLYIAVRIFNPSWQLSRRRAVQLAGPAGLLGGVLQGAGGISAPVSITFLNAMRPSREEFIATICIFFLAMAAIQIPTLIYLGILTPDRIGIGLLGLIPLFAGIPLGSFLARFISKELFDRIILAILAIIAIRMLWAALS